MKERSDQERVAAQEKPGNPVVCVQWRYRRAMRPQVDRHSRRVCERNAQENKGGRRRLHLKAGRLHMGRESRQIGQGQDKMHPFEVDDRSCGVIVTAAGGCSSVGFRMDSVSVKILFVMIVD